MPLLLRTLYHQEQVTTPSAINIRLNGESLTLDQPCSISDLLISRGLDRLPCAVEVNEELVPKRRHENRMIDEGDRIEIVTLVGGG